MIKIHKTISVIFHPIILPLVASITFFILSHPLLERELKYRILIIIGTATYLIPLLLLFVLKKRKLIHSYEVRGIQERKIPILFMIALFYFLAKTTSKITDIYILSFLFYGCSLALTTCYILFIKKIKASLHMIGIGGFITFFLLYSIIERTNLLFLLGILFLVAGIVGHSRISLKAHTIKEIHIGFLIGCISQLLVFTNYFFK